MKNVHIIKILGMVTIVSFFFFPVAGCGGMTASGLDLIKMKDLDNSVKLFAILGMVCAVGLIFLQDKLQLFYSAIAGIVMLLIAYLIAKSKMNSDIGNAIEMKSGAYFSMFGLIGSAIVSKVNNELLGDQPSNARDERSSNFCQSCGEKNEASAGFCGKCGTKL
jgi:hypothetical protein